MYIRRTQTRNTTSGERYYTHRLVQSKRVGGKVKQLTLLNLGRHFDVEQQYWPLLCSRIEEVLSNQEMLMPADCPAAVERHAQRIAAQLIARGQKVADERLGDTVAPKAADTREMDVQSVDVNSMALVRPRSVGVEALALWAMRQVDFPELLQSLGFTGPQQAAALGSIIGRMVEPGSERATHRWLGERSGLGELLDVDYEAMSLSSLYRISDRLLAKKTVLEAVFHSLKSELGLRPVFHHKSTGSKIYP